MMALIFMDKFIFYLTLPFRVIFGGLGFMNYIYNKEWDAKFQSLLKDNDFEIISNYEARLGDHILWIENQPYACFYFDVVLNDKITIKVRPSRYAIHKGLKKLHNNYNKMFNQAIKTI